jgi:CheY-like chemotaxis protein
MQMGRVSQATRNDFIFMVTVMEHRLSNLKPDAPPDPIEVGRTGLLVSRDLIFITKIRNTAADLGYPVLVAGTQSQAVSMIATHRPPVVLVDLADGELAASGALKAYQGLAGANVWLVAFGPHVDEVALATAKAAGFHVVLPRSLFAAKLPELLRRYFSQSPEENG